MVITFQPAPEVGVNFLILGVTVVVIRPMELPVLSANHNAPSEPAAIDIGPDISAFA
jgi:hypothetical protein